MLCLCSSTHSMYCADEGLKVVINDAVRCLKRLSSSTGPLHLSLSDQRSVNYHQNQYRSRQRCAARQSTNELSRVPHPYGIATVTTGGGKPNHSNPSRVPGCLHHHPFPQSVGIPWLTPRWIKICCSCFAQVVGLVGPLPRRGWGEGAHCTTTYGHPEPFPYL